MTRDDHRGAGLALAAPPADSGHGRVVDQEVLFKGIGRLRHVIGGPDGALYALLPTRIVRITPAPEAVTVAAKAPALPPKSQ